jgi:copper chaperone CopZ
MAGQMTSEEWDVANVGGPQAYGGMYLMTATAAAHVTYIAPDISCGHCVGKVRDGLEKVEGVLDVQASAETRMVDVDFDPAIVSPDRIKQALADAGYPAKS